MSTVSLFDDNRAAWGAAPSTNPSRVDPSRRVGISWHYPGSATLGISPGSPHSACLSRVKTWQTQHQNKGWADIGYNLLICQHARVIEGRGVDMIGAHSPGVNREHYGIQLMVSNTTAPTPAMYARAVKLRADLEARSGHKLRQWGHRDDPDASTACPGDLIEAWVRAGGPYRTTTPTTTTQEAPVTPAEIEAVAQRVAQLLPAKTWGYRNASAGATQDAYADLRGIGPAIGGAIAELGGQVAQLRAEIEGSEVDPAEVYEAARRAILDVIGATLTVEVTAGPPTVAEPSGEIA